MKIDEMALKQFVTGIARMTQDGEVRSGETYQWEQNPDDAVETVRELIDQARELTRDPTEPAIHLNAEQWQTVRHCLIVAAERFEENVGAVLQSAFFGLTARVELQQQFRRQARDARNLATFIETQTETEGDGNG